MKPALPAPSFAMNSGVSITRPISAWAVVCVWLPAPSVSRSEQRDRPFNEVR